MGFSWTPAPDEAAGRRGRGGRRARRGRGGSIRSRITLLVAALAAAAALVVVGIVTGKAALVLVAAVAALAIWPALQGVERSWSGDDWNVAAGPVRWLPTHRRPADAGLAGSAPVEGEARLLFVDVDARTITIDGILATDTATGDGFGEPFWIRFRRPDTGWLSASLVGVAQRWIDEGRAVRLVTRRTEAGTEAVLTAPGSRMAVALEEVGGVERPAA